LVTPVAIGRGHHLFEAIDTGAALNLIDVRPFKSGVVLLTYIPK
jgi:hypothetical protein